MGCILFMVYARARFSDMMNVCELVIEAFELDGKRDGFAEAIENVIQHGSQGQVVANVCNYQGCN